MRLNLTAPIIIIIIIIMLLIIGLVTECCEIHQPDFPSAKVICFALSNFGLKEKTNGFLTLL
jgi:hypothetical protein